MKILYYDCALGIKGECNIEALINLGVDKHYFLREIAKIMPFKIGDCDFGEKDSKENIVSWIISKINSDGSFDKKKGYSYWDIEIIIEESSLNSSIKENSKLVIKEIFHALSKTINTKLEELEIENSYTVSYLVNVTGTFICLDYIKPSKIFCSKIGVGNGVVIEDGIVKPVPSELVSRLIQGRKVSFFSSDSETIDEVGVAILNHIVDEFIEKIDFTIEKTAYGFSKKSPSFFRLYYGEMEEYYNFEGHRTIEEKQFIIECNMDDMNSELYEHVMKKLFDAGALDVYLTNIIMKKGRPAIKLSVLCKANDIEKLNEIIFIETTTFGTRSYEVTKDMLQRSFENIHTQYGEVTVKKGFYEGKLIKAKPEYEECRKISEKLGISITQVYYNIVKEIEKI